MIGEASVQIVSNVIIVMFDLLGILAVGITMCIYTYLDRDTEAGIVPSKGERYKPGFVAYFFYSPVLLGVLLLIYEMHGSIIYRPVFLFICLYACLLLLLLPILRKFLSARTCALLWTLPYTCMYFYLPSLNVVSAPMIVIPLPIAMKGLPKILLIIWIIGIAVVLLWYLIGHVLFRRKLLGQAYPVENAEIRRIWEKEHILANITVQPYELSISPQAKTPLSIGLFRRTTYVILPEREYTPEELSLIFRHELIHISRRDSLIKFFMLLLTALFWFNPLMWIAMRRSADDFELSCDETVLLGCEQQTRHQYAALLLNTAADQRGFTTCLSASAKALRYRMKNAIVPRKRWQGGVLVGILFITLSIGIIFGDFSYNPGTAAERIFENRVSKDYICTDAVLYDGETSVECISVDTETLMKYLLDLPVSRLMRHYKAMGLGLGKGAQVIVETQEDKYVLWLFDRYLRVRTYPEGNAVERCYALLEPVNWEYLTSVLQKT